MADVLVVDGDPAILELMEDMLLFHRISSVGAASGREALRLLPASGVRVVMTGINLPDMDGVQLAQAIKKDYTGIVVLACTARKRQELFQHFDQILAKPLLLGELGNTLKYYLGVPTGADQFTIAE